MRLISLWEPWATLMALGEKLVETRSWSTSYRGWLAIHASKGGLSKRDLAGYLADPEFKWAIQGAVLSPGRIVAVVKLVDCCPTVDMIPNPAYPSVFRKYPHLDTRQERAFGDYHAGRWAWVTDEVYGLPEPIPFRAKQGLCAVPEEVVREIEGALKLSLSEL